MHCDPADLTLLALGDDVPVDLAHLDSCDSCQRELAALRRTVAAARQGSPSDVPVVPPPRVWDDVRRELALRDAPRASAPPASAPPAASPRTSPAASVRAEVTALPDVTARPEVAAPGARPAAAGSRPAEPGHGSSSSRVAEPRSFLAGAADGVPSVGPAAAAGEVPAPARGAARRGSAPHRRSTWPLAAAAAAAGLVIGGGAVWIANRPAEPFAPEVLATAALDPLPRQDARGTARVVVGSDGQRRLVVDLEAPAVPAATYREVWLADSEAERLVSLGVLNGRTGEFALPQGLDLGTYVLVDVSDEPEDGNPRHSGASLVRGTLDA